MKLIAKNSSGLCDRITTGLMLQRLAAHSGRRAILEWPLNRFCNCPFDQLFESASKMQVQSDVTPHEVMVDGSISTLLIKISSCSAENIRVAQRYRGHNFDNFENHYLPRQEISVARTEFMNSHWWPNVFSVHVRRTDKLRTLAAPSNEDYYRAVDLTLDLLPDARIFFSADEEGVEPFFKSRYGTRLLTFPARSFNRSRTSAITDALITLLLLRETKFVIGCSYSGFSLCGGWNNGLLDIGQSSGGNHGWDKKSLYRPLSSALKILEEKIRTANK